VPAVRVDRELLASVLMAWLASRAIVAVAWLVATVPDRSGRSPVLTGRLAEGLLAWDGQWYLRIADEGYRAGGEEVRFWPLFPALGRLVGSVTGGPEVGLVVVSNLAALGAMALLGLLVREVTGDRRLASRSVWALALWPASFVLVFAYAEGLLLAASIGVALAARRGAWGWAAAAGLAAGLSRPNGLAVVVLALGYAMVGLGAAGGRERLARAAAVVAPMAGFGLVLVGAGRWHGDAWAPVSSQSPFRGDVVDPVSRMVRGAGDLLGDERFGDGLHLPFAVVAVVLVVLVARRVGPVEAAYSAVLVLVALSADNWNSLERYVLNAFPVFWALGSVTASRRVERLVLPAGAAALVGLTVLAWTGDFVP
jgi:hypothetical protein